MPDHALVVDDLAAGTPVVDALAAGTAVDALVAVRAGNIMVTDNPL
jgi:hypothetical protein